MVVKPMAFIQRGRRQVLTQYYARVRPWFWFLSLWQDCKIFQNMTVPAIVEKIFTDHGFNDFQPNLYKTYTPRVYCVQYRETDFNFVSRLMEQEGIYYFFQHENGKHTLVLADSISAHSPCTSASSGRSAASTRPRRRASSQRAGRIQSSPAVAA